LAFVCYAYSEDDAWDETFPVFVNISKKHMNVGAEGGHLPDVFYTMQLDRYGSRYISLHKENEADPGRIVWALYSEKNGMLDSAIVDEKGKLYKSVGGGAGGTGDDHGAFGSHRVAPVVVTINARDAIPVHFDVVLVHLTADSAATRAT
jgi:hypothetical protein